MRIGDEILEGKYRIGKIIGEGAFGKVYLAHDVPLDRRVAVKELRREDWTEEKYVEFRRRFQREARIGAALKHGSIVDVYTLEPRGDDFYLVMEYVDGLSLAERLEQAGPLPIEETVEISMQLCDGLAAMHDHPLGIVHRDIKPSNILLTSEGRPKITDFGLAQLHGESLRSLGLGRGHPGTPVYMSPEQESTVGYLRPASDIYSLGCVLFEMLTGKMYKRVEGTKAGEWRPDLPGWLDEVLDKMLSEDWRLRYGGAAQLRADLEKGASEEIDTRRRLAGRLEDARKPAEKEELGEETMARLRETVPEGEASIEEIMAWTERSRNTIATEERELAPKEVEELPPIAEDAPPRLRKPRVEAFKEEERKKSLYDGRIRVASWRRYLITPCKVGERVITMFVRDTSKPTRYRVAGPDEQLSSYVILGTGRIVSVPGEAGRKYYKVEILEGPNEGRTISLDRPWFLNDAELELRQRLVRW